MLLCKDIAVSFPSWAACKNTVVVLWRVKGS
nr:MAG TPA: hypothetical protein [Caudoviricetes sp.]